jgi:MMPL family protein
VTFSDDPYSEAALARVDTLRDRLRDLPGSATALVGAGSAVQEDFNVAAERDLRVIIPVALVVIAIILGILLQAIVAPVVLIATVMASFFGTIGLSIFFFIEVQGSAGVDASLPTFAFIFLVALGVDYTIFLMSRVREEARRHGTREGVLRALTATGPVITSAGVILAGTFAVLMSLPVMFAFNIGFMVAVGILLDTFVVRTIMVPAAVELLGDRVWWPSTARGGSRALREHATPEDAAVRAGRLTRAPHHRGTDSTWIPNRAPQRADLRGEAEESVALRTRCRLVEERARALEVAHPPPGEQHPRVLPLREHGLSQGTGGDVALERALEVVGCLSVAAQRRCEDAQRGRNRSPGRGAVPRAEMPVRVRMQSFVQELGAGLVAQEGASERQEAHRHEPVPVTEQRGEVVLGQPLEFGDRLGLAAELGQPEREASPAHRQPRAALRSLSQHGDELARAADQPAVESELGAEAPACELRVHAAADLDRREHQPLALVGSPVVQDTHRAHGPGLPFVERLADLGGDLVERGDLAVDRHHVAHLNKRAKLDPVATEEHREVGEVARPAQDVVGAGETPLELVRRPRGNEPAVHGDELCRRVADALGDLDRLPAECLAALHEPGEVELDREAGEEADAQDTVLVIESRQRFLEQADEGLVDARDVRRITGSQAIPERREREELLFAEPASKRSS